MSALAYTETDLRIASASPAEQRARHREFQEKLALAAEALAASKAPPPPPLPPPPAPVVEAAPVVPPVVCLCSRCAAEIAPSEPDPPVQAYPKVGKIQAEVAGYYGVSMIDMSSMRRTANVVRPRQVAMYLAKVLTLKSLPEIGRRFGGKDHTTVLHAVRKIGGFKDHGGEFVPGLVHTDADLAAQVSHLFNVITGGAV